MDIDKDAIGEVLAAHRWTAEYEPSNPEDEPVRFVFGSAGYRGQDPVLTLHYGEMAISGHATLDLSVWGISGTIASVDLVTTPIGDVPKKIAEFAQALLAELVENAARALRCAHTLPTEPQKPITSDGGEF